MRQRRQSGNMAQSYTPGAKRNNAMVSTAQWQTQGFPSVEAANLVTTIANAATAPTAQNRCLTALAHSLAPLQEMNRGYTGQPLECRNPQSRPI
jgi:hypothetical protein